MRRFKAFTLIEVLVVIALIALLAAMLFPVFSQAKLPAKSTACLTNLHSLDLSISLYAQDADSRYPYAADPADKYAQLEPLRKDLPLLSEVLQSYTKSREVWKCPLDVGIPPKSNSDEEPVKSMIPNTTPSVYAKYGSSYGYDSRLGTEGAPHPATLIDQNLNIEHGPSEVPVLTDLFSEWHGSPTNRRANVLYADGHVRSVRWPDYFQSGAWIVR